MRKESPRERTELALSVLLGGDAEREQARASLRLLSGDEDDSRALAAALAHAGEELRAGSRWSARQEARLVSRVLGRTTRQDPSWRGDVRLLFAFLRARLRASPAFRLVVASLVLHLVGAPALAYWILRERVPERRFTLHVELPAEEPFASESGPRGDEPPDADDLERLARRREARENALARTRYLLTERGPSAPLSELPPGAPRELVLLAARAHCLRTRSPVVGAAPEEHTPEPSQLALALWVEAELDRLALGVATSSALPSACSRLVELSSDARLAGRAPGTSALLKAALARAVALGLVDGPPPPSAPALLSPEWFAALAAAGREAGIAEEPLWRAWLAWGER